MFRRRAVLLFIAPLAVVAMFMSLAARPAAQAAELGGAQYNPGTATVISSGDLCSVNLPVTVTAPDTATAERIHAMTQDRDAMQEDYADGTYAFVVPGSISGTTVSYGITLAGLRCADVGMGTSQEGTSQEVSLAALPKWAKIAIAGLVAAGVFVAITAGVGAVLEAVAAGAAETAVGAAVAGCIGGAVSTAMNNLITGAAKTTTDNVSSAVVGCLTGGVTAQLGPFLKPLASRLGNTLRGLAGLAPHQVAGPVLEEVATAAAVDVGNPLVEMVTGAAQGAERVAAA
jgi:hypothetical protein